VIAIACRALNAGFGFVILFPIYSGVVVFHVITLFNVIPGVERLKSLATLLIVSQILFVAFFILSMDASDSVGGLTILVVLERFGIKGLATPGFFYGTNGVIIHFTIMFCLLTANTIALIRAKRNKVQ
jgi:hypothetical protein